MINEVRAISQSVPDQPQFWSWHKGIRSYGGHGWWPRDRKSPTRRPHESWSCNRQTSSNYANSQTRVGYYFKYSLYSFNPWISISPLTSLLFLTRVEPITNCFLQHVCRLFMSVILFFNTFQTNLLSCLRLLIFLNLAWPQIFFVANREHRPMNGFKPPPCDPSVHGKCMYGLLSIGNPHLTNKWTTRATVCVLYYPPPPTIFICLPWCDRIKYYCCLPRVSLRLGPICVLTGHLNGSSGTVDGIVPESDSGGRRRGRWTILVVFIPTKCPIYHIHRCRWTGIPERFLDKYTTQTDARAPFPGISFLSQKYFLTHSGW